MIKNCPKTPLSNCGFTLIELLIVISIISLLTGAGIAGFVNFNDRQQVQTTVKDVQALMRTAQIKARIGEGAGDCGGTNKLKGYEVTSDATSVVLNRICVDLVGAIASRTERSIVALDNITVTKSPNNAVIFLTLRGGVDLGGAAVTDVTYTIAGEFNAVEYAFQVLSTGEITEGGFTNDL